MSTNFLAQFSANLSTISAANINYSTLIGSTIIASSITANSTINVSSITTRTINYSTLSGSTLIAQAVHYSTLTGSTTTNNTMVVNSTLTGSTMTVQTVNYSTMTGSTMTINTLVIASTLTVSTLIATNNPAGVITSSMISVGASTNQSYTALAQGNYSTSTNWLSTLTNLSSTKFIAISGNAQTQLAVTQVATVSSVYYTSTIGTSWSTISNVTGLPTATQTNYSCGAVSGNGQYGILGANGTLYITSTLTSAVGPSFTTVYPPPASYIYLPFENSVTDVNGNSVVTATGSPGYVTGIVGSTAINLDNTLGGTATRYIRGTWSGLPNNVSLSGWFRATTVTTAGQYGVMFSSHSGNLSLYTEGTTGYFVFLFPSGSGSTYTLIKTSYAIAVSTWYSFFATFQTNGVCSLYVNNVLIGTSTNTGGYGSIVSSGYFSLGTYDNSTSLAFNGYIDDFRIYTSAITFSNVAISNSGQYMLATVASGGLYMSSNFGSTWSQVSAALLQAAWSLLDVSSTGQYISVYSPPVTVIPQLSGLASSTWTVNGVTWTASASATGIAGGANPYALFDTSTGAYWTSVTGTYNGSGVYVGGKSTFVNGQGSVSGEYIQLQSSTPLQLLSYTFATGSYAEYPNGLTFAGSNNGINWYLLQSVTMSGNPVGSAGASSSTTYININQSGAQTMVTTGGSATFNCTISPYSTNANTYFRIIFPAVFGGSQFVTLTEVYLRFTAGGQLYSTNFGAMWCNLLPANTSTLALSGSGQYALENINTTMVTTTPQLTGLAGASGTLWNVSGVVWTVTASTTESSTYNPTFAFNNTSASSWASTGLYPGGIYTTGGSAKTTTIGAPYSATYAGEWLQIQSSVPLVMYSCSFGCGDTANNFPRTFFIIGSNDGSSWFPIQLVNMGGTNPFSSINTLATTYLLTNYTGTQIFTANTSQSVTTTSYSTSGNAYTYFRIIANTTFGFSNFQLSEWFINFNNIFMQPQLTGLTGNTSSSTLVPTTWIANNITWVSTASSINQAGYQPWNAFNNISTSGSWADTVNYPGGAGVYNNRVSTTISAPYSATYAGEWLQIQSSVPIVMYNYSFGCSTSINTPKTYLIAGSNDGSTWFPIQLASIASQPFSSNERSATTYLLANYTGTQSFNGGNAVSVTTTAYSTSSNAYTYFRIITNTTFGGGAFQLSEWFINFTNTLTSPQLTGLSSASWTLNNIAWNSSSSSINSVIYPSYQAFDNESSSLSWVSLSNYTNTTPGVATGVTSTAVINTSSTTVNGEWLQIQSSSPLTMYSYTFTGAGWWQFPNTYSIVGSTDGTNWYLIQSVTMNQNPCATSNYISGTYIIANQSGAQMYTTSAGSATFTCTTSAYSSNAYTYFRIIAPTVWGASGQFSLAEWFINFTTTTVSPQLSGLTGATSGNTVTSWAANNVTWTSSASSVFTSVYQPWIAFDNIGTGNAGNYSWASSQIYIATTGVYNGSVSTTIAAPYSAAYAGEWLQIQSSVPVVLYNYTFACGGTGNIPKNYLIAGSNDGTTWYPIQLASMASNPFGSTNFRPATSYLLANSSSIQTLTSAAVPAGVSVTTTSYFTSRNAYTYFRIISNVSLGDQWFELEEWFINFTPTQYVTSNYLSATSSTPYTAPVFSPALTSTNVPITSAASQTGQYMVLITNNASGANVYYSTNYGANFTGLTIGTSTMVSCAISSDGSYITVMNATTVYQLNNNSIGFSVAVGNQAGQQNQAQNAIAIGSFAGQQNQTANSIVLNATGAALNSYVPGFYVAPIQQYGASTGLVNVLGYGSDNQVVQASVISLLPSGNVGIGTTNPLSLLHVNGAITASGNVGIGTTAPKNLLHVNGKISTPWIQFNNLLVGSLGWHIYDNDTTDTLYILQGSANNGVYLANGGGSWTSWSDIRIKNTINPISGALNIINQLNPVTFYYKSDIKYEFLKSGFIAQEVQTILPDLVSDSLYSNEYGSNLLGVETTGFIPFIIKAIQEQNEIIQQQSNKLQQQAAEITALQSTVAQNIQPQVNAQQIQIAELMSQINQLTQRLVAAGIA